MSKIKGPLTTLWDEARMLFKEGKLEEATDKLDMGILHLAAYSLKGIKDDEVLEGIKKSVWYERYWVFLQNNIWPTYSDYEENWKLTS